MTVSVPFSAEPNQVLDAFRRIQEEARKTGRELKNLGDVNFPGLEDAKRQLEHMNVGLQQMMSPAVRTRAAESLRAGVKAGLYQPDIVSVLNNAQRQFPDPKALQNHLNSLMLQSGNIAAMGGGGGGRGPGSPGGPGWYGGPSMGGAIGGMMSGNIGGIAGGVIGGIGGPIGAMIGATIGGKLQAAIGKYAEQSMQEAFGMSDLRLSVYGINEEFGDFRENIRAAGDGLGVTYNETLALSKSFAQLSGVSGSGGIASGTRAGIALSRQFGLDPSQGASMMGRMAFLGLGGGDPKKQAQMLAEAMAGSNLGARQSDAAEAMIRFAERSASMIGDGGNVAGYTGRLLALFNSSDKGIRANAAGILGGYDESVRAGGRAGDAGKNFIYNVMSRNGTADPFDIEMALEGGFAGKMGNGKMIGPELIKQLQSQYGGMGKNAMASATKGLFGGSASVAAKVIDLLEKNPSMGNAEAAKKVEALMADLNKGDEGSNLRIASANLNNAAQKLLGDNMIPVMTKMNEVLGDLTNAINQWLGGSAPVYSGDVGKTASKYAEYEKTASRMAERGSYGTMAGTPGYQLIQDQSFMQIVQKIAKENGVTMNKTKFTSDPDLISGKSGVDNLFISSKTEEGAMAFVSAVTQLASAVKEGIQIHVSADGKATIGKRGGAIPYPKNR